MSRTEIAWAAGFFDGEGHTSSSTRGTRHRRKRLSLQISQSGTAVPQVLVRFRSAVGDVGYIYGPIKRTARWTPQWKYTISDQIHVQAVLTLLWPYLGEVKKAQATQALLECGAQPDYRRRLHWHRSHAHQVRDPHTGRFKVVADTEGRFRRHG